MEWRLREFCIEDEHYGGASVVGCPSEQPE